MAKPNALEEQLESWKIVSDENQGEVKHRVLPVLRKLPKSLKAIALAVLGLNDDADEVDDDDEDESEAQREARRKKRKDQLRQFDQLPANDRKKVFAAVAPDLADWIEAAWQLQKTMPYQSRRAFRAAGFPDATIAARAEWLSSFARETAGFKPETLNLAWLARWAKHAFERSANLVVPLLAAAMNAPGRDGDEVFDILYKTITREDPVGIMSEHVIQSLLLSDRAAGWEIIEKTLLAAQRQEGLRQSILQNADMAHPEAFRRLLRLIIDKDLIRFSSVARCVNVWLGLLWDSISTKELSQNVESLLHLLENSADRKQALASDAAEQVYRALCASAHDDAVSTIPVAAKLLKHSKEEVRFVATWVLTLISLERSEKAKTPAIDDPSLQVALLAAVRTEGIPLGDMEPDFDVDDVHEKDAFERLERLYSRLPEKPRKLAAMVWPWTERKIERSMIAECLLSALGDRAPTKILPYMKGLHPWHQRDIVERLAKQKKWDALTRTALLELAGHSSNDVREAALQALEKQTLRREEREVLEGYLTRLGADLRNGVMGLLLKSDDRAALDSAARLLTKRDRQQRLAGVELLRQMCEAGRSRQECQVSAAEYRASRKSLVKEEETQLAAIEASDRATLSLDNALGLMNPDGRSKVFTPEKRSVLTISKAAVACLKSLDDLIHAHRTTIVTIKRWKTTAETPLGQLCSHEFPWYDSRKPVEKQCSTFPLFSAWKEWSDQRGPALRDQDGLELLRAAYASELFDEWHFDEVKDFCKKADRKKVAIAILGEIDVPKLRYLEILQGVLDFLALLDPPQNSVDFLLDCAENTYAHVPDAMMRDLVTKKPKKNRWDDDEDWRTNKVFEFWPDCLRGFLHQRMPKLTHDQTRRAWDLLRFHDEPCPGAPRKRLDLEVIVEACRDKLATKDDVVDCLLGKRSYEYDSFDELSRFTARTLSKSNQAVLDQAHGLSELLTQAKQIILESELVRGEAPTVTTKPALALRSLKGTSTLFRVMSALNKGKLKVERGWRGEGDGRNATLTHLMKITYPAASDTAADFARSLATATQEGYCSEARLLELTFLAPQWSRLVGEVLGWDGFSEGLYWFLAHMNAWYSDATQAAASAEGLVGDDDDDDEEEDEFDLGDDDEDNKSESGASMPKPRKLSAWERLVLERTPLTAEERGEGAVDVAWFHRTWQSLGEKRWQLMADAAKFAANSAQANKAQFLADVLLGRKSRQELVDGIQKKFRKEYVRLLGLLPLESGAKRDKDLIQRYEVLQGYKKYARGLSSLTKPSAMRAVEIGMNNLSRLAGFPDPLRMEWALEAESIRDIARGPVSVTRDGITVTLSLDEQAKARISVMRGDKPLKSIPAPVKKKHPAIAELADRATELKRKSGRIKQSLEAAMCRGDQISAAELVQLFEHAILAPQLGKLVLIGDGILGYPDKGGKALRGHNGKLEPIKKDELLRIAHPQDLFDRGDWDKWQQECFRAERVQPFKQIFRELYVITKQEKKDGTTSSRFAGQQVGPKQAMALWNSRGWNTEEGVCRIFHDLSLIAEVSFQYDYGTAAEVEGLTMEQVFFRKRDDDRPLRLTEVPSIVFSEIMRDVDLVVSVAHRGEVDPEASASTVEMRTALVRETCQLLKLSNVKVKAQHAIVDGYYGEYSLHLGSGSVQRIPGGALAILPVHAQHRGRLFLPFADDDPRTAEIMAKVLLLARDEEIMDPTILDQLGAHAGKRKVLKLEEPTPPKSVGEKGARTSQPAKGAASHGTSASTTAGPAYGKRYFEFSEGTSNKFWEVELSGNSVTTRWGRIGSDGQSKTKEFADSVKAKAEYDKLVGEKVRKGYIES